MKKYKLFAALSVIGAGFALASCGNTAESSTSGATSTPKPTDTLPSTTTTTGTTPSGQVKNDKSYVVNVKYPNGEPVKGAKVQWCSVENGTCYSMIPVDDNGQAFTNELETIEGDFNVHVNSLPAGYTFDPYEIVQNKDNHVSDAVITKLADATVITDATATSTSPKQLSQLGYYTAKITKGKDVYFYLDINEAGTYEIESYANETSDLLIGYCGNDIEKIGDPNKYDNNSGNKGNFKYSFTVSEEEASQNKHYVFLVRESASTTSFAFSVLKKSN